MIGMYIFWAIFATFTTIFAIYIKTKHNPKHEK
jgi:NADH:ubiquinone oxidoreductase subunit 6 (subunit J)